MTQAALTPERDDPTGLRSPDGAARRAATSEAALWLFGLTAATLVLASLALLALLAQDAMADARLSGFVSALALVTGVVGAVALAYVVISADRAGHLALRRSRASDAAAVLPGDPPPAASGLRVVPAIPADLAARRRSEVAGERAARSAQARAVATVEASRRLARPLAPTPARRTAAAPTATPVVPAARAAIGLVTGRPWLTSAPPRTASRPAGVPASLRVSPAPGHPHAGPAQLQTSVANARRPFLPPNRRPW